MKINGMSKLKARYFQQKLMCSEWNYIKRAVSSLIRADFQQGMESMTTVTEKYWLIYAAAAAATVILPYHVGYYFQSLS